MRLMAAFDAALLSACATTREVELTTFGRRTGRAARVIIWVVTDGERVYIRSGQGLTRDWPRNLLARGRAVLHVEGRDVPVRGALLPAEEGRRVSGLVAAKYGAGVRRSAPGEPPTPGEQTTFELTPDEA
jgi:hypothetical protein